MVLKLGATGSPATIYPPDSLVLRGDPYRSPVVLSPPDFHALPHITIKVHNGHTNAEESYSGVSLETLLAKANAPVGKEFRKEALGVMYWCPELTDTQFYFLLRKWIPPSMPGK